MKQYRLKEEAVPFFKEKYATAIMLFDAWEELGVDSKALEEVEEAHISYGVQRDGKSKSCDLSGWSADDGSRFHFTIHFPSVKFREHDKFGNGKIIRELMNRIQNQVNYFYSDYVNKELI